MYIQADNRPEAWQEAACLWLEKLAPELGEAFRVHESRHFFVLTNEEAWYTKTFLKFLERARTFILGNLQGIARADDERKYVVVIVDSDDQYYPYISYFYPEHGEFAFSGGICIHAGYDHFVFPACEIDVAESTAAHELTHACLQHLPIPLWLNEGIAKTVEEAISSTAPLRIDREIIAEHQGFWENGMIQEFWSGKSFFRPDEGNRLSYHLAQMAVKTLSHDVEVFREFVLQAHRNDGGEAAAQECFGNTLGALIEQFLGEGDWTPMPKRWKT